jgi:hypothetical protein
MICPERLALPAGRKGWQKGNKKKQLCTWKGIDIG